MVAGLVRCRVKCFAPSRNVVLAQSRVFMPRRGTCALSKSTGAQRGLCGLVFQAVIADKLPLESTACVPTGERAVADLADVVVKWIAGAAVLYSEDLSDGQTYGSVRIVNPLANRHAPP